MLKARQDGGKVLSTLTSIQGLTAVGGWSPFALIVVLALALSSCQGDDFTGPDGLIANHAGYWNGVDQDPQWAVESGSLYRRSNVAMTTSPVFRAWSKREDFKSVRVEFDLQTDRFTNGSADRPPRAWDGVKIWLHARHTDGGILGAAMPGSPAGYTAEVSLRDGRIYVQKKVAGRWKGGNHVEGGTYFLLSSPVSRPPRMGEWERVGGAARDNPDGSVTIQVIRNGEVALRVTDRGERGGPPLTGPGRIGVRADNTDFQIDNLRVLPAS
jgi:hypothetical protein